MANSYCTLEQLNAFIDGRLLTALGMDGDAAVQSEARQQMLLDAQAAWMESLLAGWYQLPLVDSTTGVAPMVCTRYVAVSTAVLLLGRRLSEYKAIETMYVASEKWLEAVSVYQASIPNVTRLNSAHPALVSSDNMTGLSANEYIPYMTVSEFSVGTSGASGTDYAGSAAYNNGGGGIGQ